MPKKEKEESPKKQEVPEGDLIDALKEQDNFLMQKYNDKMQQEKPEKTTSVWQENRPTRAGGVYVPPHKLRELQQELMDNEKSSIEHQKLMWELLRKSINGIINKVNITNIQNVLIELLNENILRGKGLLARAIIKAQMASPNFTHVYTALIAVINTKLPEIVNLIIKRVVLQFQRAYKRNNKIVCMATTKMMAHLINQKVLHDFVGLELLLLLLEQPTEDSVELACDFMVECGQVLQDLSPQGVTAIFERFKGILHEGEIDKRVQYSIENLFAVRKTKFKDHPGVIPELDLVEEDDQITHNVDLTDPVDGEEKLNIFRYDAMFDRTEQEWEDIKHEILGEENIIRLKTQQQVNFMPDEREDEDEEFIEDFTEKDLLNLKRVIYLTIQSSVDYEECLHKIIKMKTGLGHEEEVCNMIIDCCMQERTYITFYGLLGQRLCEIAEVFRDNFMKCFVDKYATMHRYDTSKIRNVAKFFSHLLYSLAIDWRILKCITLTQDNTTSSGRIFIKCLFQELGENMSLERLNDKLREPELKPFVEGLFPQDHPKNTRFAINFFTSIGQGALTEELRLIHQAQSQLEFQNAQAQLMKEEEEEEDSSESSSSSSSSSESSDSSESDDSSDSDSSEDSRKKVVPPKKTEKPLEKSKQKPKEKPAKEKLKEKPKEKEKEKEKSKQKPKEKAKPREKSREKSKERKKQREREKAKTKK